MTPPAENLQSLHSSRHDESFQRIPEEIKEGENKDTYMKEGGAFSVIAAHTKDKKAHFKINIEELGTPSN